MSVLSVCLSVCPFVGMSVRTLCVGIERVFCKNGRSIEMPFGVVGWVGPRNYVLDGSQDPPREGVILGMGGAM